MSWTGKISVVSTGVGWVVAVASKLFLVNRYDSLGDGRVGFDCESPLFVGVLVAMATALLVIGAIASLVASRKDHRTRPGRVVLALSLLGLLWTATTIPRLRQEWRHNHEAFSPCL